MIDTCDQCGGAVSLRSVEREVPTGTRSVRVQVEALCCAECGELYLAPGQMTDMQRRAAEIARRADGLLSPEEIRELRGAYGLSQDAFEQLINAGPKTVTRWERGTVCQNGTADTLMRILRDNPELTARLAAERGVAIRPGSPPRDGGSERAAG